MIIYEVNLKIQQKIYEDYILWLQNHIQDMLSLNLFHDFKLFKIDSLSKNIKNVTIHYYLENIDLLNIYYEKHATKMRNSVDKKFISKVTFERRILHEN